MEMFNLLFDNTTMPVLQQVMSFSENRQKVLAHSVANINTPGFRTMDLPVEEFLGALGDAIETRDRHRPRRFEMKSTRSLKFGTIMQCRAQDTRGLMNYFDGADRSVEHLQNEMLKNAMWHEAATRLFRHQSDLLRTAIRQRL